MGRPSGDARRDAQRITRWLQQNPTTDSGRPTNQADAKQALGITGKFKSRQGNLTNDRGSLRYSADSSSGIADQRRAEMQRQTTPDPAVRRRTNIKGSYINRRGGVADHRLTNSMLARGEQAVLETRGPAGVEEMRQRYESVGGYGHSPQNLQQLAAVENSAKEAQEKKLSQYYKHLEKKPAETNQAAYDKWVAKRDKLAQGINQNLVQRTRIAPGGGVNKFAYSTPIKPQANRIKSNNGQIRFGIPSSTNPLSALNRGSAAYGGIETQTNEAIRNMPGVSPIQSQFGLAN